MTTTAMMMMTTTTMMMTTTTTMMMTTTKTTIRTMRMTKKVLPQIAKSHLKDKLKKKAGRGSPHRIRLLGADPWQLLRPRLTPSSIPHPTLVRFPLKA